MLYTYTNDKELAGQYMNDRKAMVITDIVTKDINEYINSFMAYLYDIRVNTELFVQPKIVVNNIDSNYSLVIMLRAKNKGKAFNNMLNNIIKHLNNDGFKCEALDDYICKQKNKK